jgi:mannose-6-phosphate isomerase-like protein (cupin superfamily)
MAAVALQGEPMQSLHISRQDMEARVSRFHDLKPLPVQSARDVPQAARDVVYARELLSVIGLEGHRKTAINTAAPIIGAGGMTMTIARCPPGQGPGLHIHKDTFETFTVLEGTFEVIWNQDEQHSLVLERFDTISLPPKVYRAFRNVGATDGLLQVIITGGVHDMNDIAFSSQEAARLDAIAPQARKTFEELGFRFQKIKQND